MKRSTPEEFFPSDALPLIVSTRTGQEAPWRDQRSPATSKLPTTLYRVESQDRNRLSSKLEPGSLFAPRIRVARPASFMARRDMAAMRWSSFLKRIPSYILGSGIFPNGGFATTESTDLGSTNLSSKAVVASPMRVFPNP